MRVAAIYDIHGNLPALEAVLAEIDREAVDEIVVGGDVLPGPMPRETLQRVLDLKIPARFITGNGDRVVLEQMRGQEPTYLPEPVREVIRHSAREITPEQAAVIAAWPKTLETEIAGVGRVLFCHATPRNDTEIFVKTTAEEKLKPIFDVTDVDLVVCGHTHMQFDRMIGNVRVVNAGSVGMPYGRPRAYWLMLGPRVGLRRTDYDLQAAAERFRETDYPEVEKFIANDLLKPKSEEEMLELFAKAEIK
jgi:putative phosphoesterase